MSQDITYDGVLPVEEYTVSQWHKDDVETVSINYVVDLYTLIDYADMDECNDDMDSIVGVPLMDLSYVINRSKTAELDDETSIVVTVEGLVDWSAAESMYELNKE